MNWSPSWFTSFAPSPRSVSERRKRGVLRLLSAVGWNWMNSRSFVLALARIAIASPSPVAISGLVVCLYNCPIPPVARIVASAKI